MWVGDLEAPAAALMGGRNFRSENKGDAKMTGQFEFEPAYYLASVLRYISQDGQYYVVGPIWECVRQIGGETHFPVVVCGKKI